MKTVYGFLQLLVSFSLIVTICFQTSFAQNCDECSRPRIVYYDCDVFAGDPPAGESWTVFYWPFATAIDNIINNSPSCISWGQVASATVENLSTGFPNKVDRVLMTAPEGSVKGWDYILRGSVVSVDNEYGFGLFLETGPTREKVISLSVHFSADEQSAKQAGLTIAAQMLPILDKIKEFEINKRNSDTEVALGNLVKEDPREITITPQKSVLDTGETIDVKIKLIDCDGVALGNRSIIFNDTVVYTSGGRITLGYGTEGGTITPEEAITDESGNVTVQFKAGPNPGVGNIIAWFPYTTPCGHPRVYEGKALVQIEPPRTDLWILRGNVNYHYSMLSDTTMSFDLGGHSMEKNYSSQGGIETNGRVIAVIENIAEDPSKDFSYSSDAVEPISLIVSGSGIMNDFSKYEELIDGKLINANIRNDNVSGYAYPGASIYFDYTEEYKFAGIGVWIKATGQYDGRMFFYEWSDYGGDYDDYALSASGDCDPDFSEGACSIVRQDTTGYSANYSFSENSKELNPNGTRHITRNKSMTLSIAPYNPLTSVNENEYAQLFPAEFSLSQNYPNPFNPSTTISYQLPKAGKVTLKVYDILGNEIATLINTHQSTGSYQIPFHVSSLSSGIYFYSLTYDNKSYTRKMMIMK